MPSDGSHSQPLRLSLEHRLSSGSQQSSRSHHDTSDSPSTSPPSTSHKAKGPKAHAVGHRPHTRVQSNKGLHKLVPVSDNHANTKRDRRAASPATSPGSVRRNHSETKLPRTGTTSTTSLKRNRSHVEVKRPKSSSGMLKRSASQPGVNNLKALKTSVHFDLGNDGQEDGWTEASDSASPELSRAGSAAGMSSVAKTSASANDFEPQSPHDSPATTDAESPDVAEKERHSTSNVHQITSQLLSRTENAPPQMSSVSAIATPLTHTPSSFPKVNSNVDSIARSDNDELTSRFKGQPASGTPNSTSPVIAHHPRPSSPNPKPDPDSARRAKSMNNLASHDSSFSTSDEDRALAPKARKTSHAYNPPQQSRTQQKLWLQRASSNMEPQPNGAPPMGLHAGANASPLVGVGYDGRDPRIRMQLERTGLAYLVVRRYQDPVGRALKRLELLPGAQRMRRIPPSQQKRVADGAGRFGLSQSLKEMRSLAGNGASNGLATVSASGAGSSFEAHPQPVQQVAGSGNGSNGSTEVEEDDLGTTLRGLWEKSFEMSASAE